MERLYSISEVARVFGVSVPTLRYYEERGLIQPTARRGRVRQYDRGALERLAYAQLWHGDGMMSLADTAAIMTSEHAPERHALISARHDAVQDRIDRLSRAAAILRHMLRCPADHPLSCPVTGAYIRSRVDAALAGEEPPEPAFPSMPASHRDT
ncbi:MerR family transcriptional regulator [Streptomyces misionensis]|uniref:MerR family transcriptional regulator n=1 Tax=Streptomyces misionensis TaxID=67331 RepID=A0A5C6JWU6_9ACTN|nr:MerR family transcriptional regulator [Streptomyces misionensis]TWV53707.1 MerR family transcriptional regulator [Streptomyces misionensis]